MSPLYRKKGLWIGLISFVVLALAAQVAYRALSEQQGDDSSFKMLAEGEVMPAKMPLLNSEGKLVTFADYSGKVVLVNFWAAWCGPCIKEMPSLYALQKQFGGKGFQVLGVSMDDDFVQGVAGLNRLAGPAPFPQFKGQEQAIAARFPIEGLPFSVIVDKSGKIVCARAGERDWQEPGAVKFVEGLL